MFTFTDLQKYDACPKRLRAGVIFLLIYDTQGRASQSAFHRKARSTAEQ